jgi:hypothetical protein
MASVTLQGRFCPEQLFSFFCRFNDAVYSRLWRTGKDFFQFLVRKTFFQQGNDINSLLPAAYDIPAGKTLIEGGAVGELHEHA